MTPEEFNIRLEELTRQQKRVLRRFLRGESDQTIATALYCDQSTIRRHISHICRLFGLTNESGERFSYRQELVDLFVQHQPEWVNFEVWDSHRPQRAEPDFPGRPVNPESPFYIKRFDRDFSCIETWCAEAVLKPGALIRIKAATNMGKTSLLNHILTEAANDSYRTVRLNLRQADPASLGNLNHFLQWFCRYVSHQLQIEQRLNDYWDNEWLDCMTSCTEYFQAYLLEQIDTPVVLGLDEVDRLFEYPTIAEAFFSLLRNWHEEASRPGIWQKLRLVVVYSTEVYIPLNINKSPFNVGRQVNVSELTLELVQQLARHYGLNWVGVSEAERLMAMVEGHPYLIQLALYHLYQENMTLEQLLKTAPTSNGIYHNHLQHLWSILRENPELMAAFLTVIQADGSVQLERTAVYKLESLWLVKLDDDYQVRCSCNLYRLYFSRCL